MKAEFDIREARRSLAARRERRRKTLDELFKQASDDAEALTDFPVDLVELERMTLEIPGLRKAVVRSETFQSLRELLRFRHFARYYFDLNYDWDRLDHPLLLASGARRR